MGYLRCVMALAMVVPLALLARADGIRFLPDDAQIACRAILPQSSWKNLKTSPISGPGAKDPPLAGMKHGLPLQKRSTDL